MRLIHILSGNIGIFIKETYPTGKPITWLIKLDNGQIYFAPKNEFKTFHKKQLLIKK